MDFISERSIYRPPDQPQKGTTQRLGENLDETEKELTEDEYDDLWLKLYNEDCKARCRGDTERASELRAQRQKLGGKYGDKYGRRFSPMIVIKDLYFEKFYRKRDEQKKKVEEEAVKIKAETEKLTRKPNSDPRVTEAAELIQTMTEEILEQKERLTENRKVRTGKAGNVEHVPGRHREGDAILENGRLINHNASVKSINVQGGSIKVTCCNIKILLKQFTGIIQDKLKRLPEEVRQNLESVMMSFQRLIAAMWKLMLCVLLVYELENLSDSTQHGNWNVSKKKGRMKYGFQMAAMLSLWLSHDVESNPGPPFTIRMCLEKHTRFLSESFRYHLPVEGSVWSESVAEAAYAAGYSTDCQWNNPSGHNKDTLTSLIVRATELGRLLTKMKCLPEDLAPFVTNLGRTDVQEQLVAHYKVEFYKKAVNILLGVTSFSDAHKHVILQHTRSLQEKISDEHNLSQRQMNIEVGTSSDFGSLADRNAAQSSTLIQPPSSVNTQTGQQYQSQSGQQLDTQNVPYIGGEAALFDLNDFFKLFDDMQPQNQTGQNALNAEPPNIENTSSGSTQVLPRITQEQAKDNQTSEDNDASLPFNRMSQDTSEGFNQFNQRDELDSEERMEPEESVYEQPAETNLDIMVLQQLMPGSDTDEERGRDHVSSNDWSTMMDTNGTRLGIQGGDAEQRRDQHISELRSKEDWNAVGNDTETELPNQKQPTPLEQIVSAQIGVQYTDLMEPEHESSNQGTQEPPGDNCQNNEIPDPQTGEDTTRLSHSAEERSDSTSHFEDRTGSTLSGEDRAGSTPYGEEMTVSTPSGEDRTLSTHNAEDRSESTPSDQETTAASPVNLGSSQHKPRSSFRAPNNNNVFTQQGEATISETKSDGEESEEENQSEDNAGEVEEEPGELPSSTERDTRRDGDESGFEQTKASFWNTVNSIIRSWESFKSKDAGNETRATHLKYVESITKTWEAFQRRNTHTVTKASYLKYIESIIKSWEMFSQGEETSIPETSFLKYVESTVDNFEVFRWSRNTRRRYLQDRNGNGRNAAHTSTSSDREQPDHSPSSTDSLSRKRTQTNPSHDAKKRKE